jgi:hypothetical protein
VGALTALVVGLIIGLFAIAVGAHQLGTAARIADFHKVSVAGVIFAIGGAFAANAAGGWVAAKMAGLRISETAMLHGSIVWMIAIPVLLVMSALGAGSLFGGWYGGLAGTPAWIANAPAVNPIMARNEAIASVVAILAGLMGAVVGGWAASGEPMNFTHWRTRTHHEPGAVVETRTRRVDAVTV